MILPGRHSRGMNWRMTAPVQGYLPNNIDGRLPDPDSDKSSDFCLRHNDAHGGNQISAAE
jgi:hypothetical protein